MAGHRALRLKKPLDLEKLDQGLDTCDGLVELMAAWTRTKVTTTAILFHEDSPEGSEVHSADITTLCQP